MNINIVELKGNYKTRTLQNIKESDATLIISCNLNTPGEKLTLKLLNEYKKPYLVAKVISKKLNIPSISLEKFIDKYNIKMLNIAGNSICRYKYIKQDELNELIYSFLKSCSNINNIKEIQSGGQTGTDEAGIIAGLKLGIKTKINMVNWMFRDENGKDISNKDLFINRFIIKE